MPGMGQKEHVETLDLEAHLAPLVPQDPPLYLVNLIPVQEGPQDHQDSLDPLDCQGERDSRDEWETKEIQVRKDLRDSQDWMERLELKERRETQDLVCQVLLAPQGPPDLQDHAVFLTEQMLLVLGLKTLKVTQNSSGDLLVSLGLQDLLVPLDLTCQPLGQLEDHFQGMQDHLDTLVGMDIQATQESQCLRIGLVVLDQRVQA